MRDAMISFFPTFILQHPDDARARVIFACQLAEAGRKDESLENLTSAIQLNPNDSLLLFNAACTFAQLGELRKSLSTLSASIAAGHENFNWIKRDSDLDPIRNDPEYIELMKDK
jgi:tetratricopeptide (TPR) repeat protein